MSGCLQNSSSGFSDSHQVVLLNSTGAEDSSVGEVLGGQVTNRKHGEDNLGSGGDNLVELLIDNVPLSIDNLLEIIWVIDSDFSVVLLSLQLELDVENGNLWVHEALRGLLETGIRESLLEANSLDVERVGNGSTGDFLDSDITLIKVLVEIQNGVDNHLGEEGLVFRDDLGVQTGLCAFDQKVSLLSFTFVGNLDGDFFDSLHTLGSSLSVTFDDDLRSHALVDESLGLFQELSGCEDNGGGSVSNLVVLRSCDINEGLGSWMDDVKKADESGAIVGDGDTSTVVDKLIHTSWPESGLDHLNDGLASIDV